MTLLLPNAGDGIYAGTTNWKFDAAVADNFEAHISKSVPMYNEVQRLAVTLSDWFIEDGSSVYDIGCATGTTLAELHKRHLNKKSLKMVGIDNSAVMLARAKDNLNGYNEQRISLVCQNIMDYSFDAPASVIYSLYTLQFINFSQRAELCKKIHSCLKDYGAFFLVEKIIESDYRVADVFTHLHWERKEEMGFKPAEIYNKAQSLRGVLKPLTLEKNLELLRGAGFRTSTFFQWCNFVGFIGIK